LAVSPDMSVHQTTGMTGTAPAGGDIITNSRRVLLVVVCISVSDMIITIILEMP
jgi:hypothetical protein